MASKPKSRWQDEEEDPAIEAQLKAEKEAKKKAKADRQRRLEAEKQRSKQLEEEEATRSNGHGVEDENIPPAAKRRRLSQSPEHVERAQPKPENSAPMKLLRFKEPGWRSCRLVDETYERLNHIEEGTYGMVSRARETATGEIVALKKFKLEKRTTGVPVTALREIQTLMASKHRNIVNLREVVMGDAIGE
jgi:cell division cycle 2-like